MRLVSDIHTHVTVTSCLMMEIKMFTCIIKLYFLPPIAPSYLVATCSTFNLLTLQYMRPRSTLGCSGVSQHRLFLLSDVLLFLPGMFLFLVLHAQLSQCFFKEASYHLPDELSPSVPMALPERVCHTWNIPCSYLIIQLSESRTQVCLFSIGCSLAGWWTGHGRYSVTLAGQEIWILIWQ